jgi:serine/threonine protein kinase
MAFKPAQDAEPIPGYRLMEKLGSGGFGEVWKASAPGELVKAIKIVFGDLQDQRAEQELKALRRIKEVRHPFLLSLERIEIIDGQLFIVTELADRSLMDCFQDYRKRGMQGIPRHELLGYLRDAADALDYMQATRDLQHLDVKPQNLLLVAGRIKVADFGLVKDLGVTSVSAAGGATPVYAPPEAFDGKVSRASDQYSLAIVYQEMLTGTRPFQGETTLQLAMQHVHGRPFLKPLPAEDRPIIAQALSKSPEERHPNCRELIDTLQTAKEGPTSSPSAQTPSLSATKDPPTQSPLPRAPAASLLPMPSLRTGLPGLMPASIANLSVLVSTVIRQGTPAAEKVAEELQGDTIAGLGGPQAEVVRPTLYIGLGGLGAVALRRLKRRFFQRFGESRGAPFLHMLAVDTDRVAVRRAVSGDPCEALAPSEALLTPLYAPEHYREKARDLLRWLDRRWLYGIPRSRRTEGIRALGRLALVDSAGAILTRLRASLTELASQETRASALACGVVFRDESPRVVIVASISGGTGSGMIVDMAYAARQVLADLDLSTDGLCGMLIHAAGKKPTDREMAQINAFSALGELNHYSEQGAFYPGDAEHGLRPCGPGQPPFEDCYVANLGDKMDRAEAEAAVDTVAEYLALDASSQGGPALDQHRRQTRQANGLALRVFALRRLATARDYLRERAATALCRQVMGLWIGDLSFTDNAAIERQAERLATSLALDAPALLKRFEATATELYGDDPLARLEPDLSASLQEFQLSPEGTITSSVTRQVLARLEQRLGAAPLNAPNSEAESSRTSLLDALRLRLREQVSHICQAIAQWLRLLVDSPGERLAASERAADWFAHHVEEQLQAVVARLSAVRTQRSSLRSQFNTDAGTTSTRKLTDLFGRGRRRETTEAPLQLLNNYCRVRLEEFLLDHAQALLAEVGRIIAHLQQELSCCRYEVKALASAITAASKGPSLDELGSLPGLTWLVPGNLPNLVEAERALLVSMGDNYARHLDRLVQQEILDSHGGLWAVASCAFGPQVGRDTVIGPVHKAIALRARRAVTTLLENYDAATLLLESSGGEEGAWQALTAQMADAHPVGATPNRPQLLLLALPSSAAGNQLRQRACRESSALPATIVDSAGDIAVCHEAAAVPLRDAMPGLTDNEGAWARLAARASTRTDVVWSGASCPAV